jgi:Tol biopolymer transport system component
VAWVEAAPTPAGPSGSLRRIRLVARAGGAPVRITAAKDAADHEEDEPVFSPDGRQLAFLSDAEQPGQPQLYVADVTGGAVRRLSYRHSQSSHTRYRRRYHPSLLSVYLH